MEGPSDGESDLRESRCYVNEHWQFNIGRNLVDYWRHQFERVRTKGGRAKSWLLESSYLCRWINTSRPLSQWFVWDEYIVVWTSREVDCLPVLMGVAVGIERRQEWTLARWGVCTFAFLEA